MAIRNGNLLWPLLISFIRLPMLFITAATALLIFKLTGIPTSLLFRADMATLYYTVVNIGCVLLLAHLFRRQNLSFDQLIDFRKKQFATDILYGLLWQIVLYVPFMLSILTTMWLLFGTQMFEHFAYVFVPQPDSLTTFPYGLTVAAAIVSATIFPLLNAPIEEIMYRGYAQTQLIAITQKRWFGFFIPALGFSWQHIVLAPTWAGAFVYAIAFFVWGIGAGIIYLFQQRLLPLIVAHFVTNLIFGLLPLLFLLI